MGASQLVAATRAGFGHEIPAAQRKTEVTILDVFSNAASAKIDAGPWIDYLHLARVNGRWVIVNVLWEMLPRGGAVSRRATLAIAVPAILVPAALFALLEPPRFPPPVGLQSGSMAHPSPAYSRLLARHVRDGTIEGMSVRVVDYAAIPEDPDYQRALAELAEARPETMGREERLAYWINAYNLLAIRLVADRYPVG